MRLGCFNQVTISTSRKAAPRTRSSSTSRVTERLTGTFQVGAGFGTIENFVLQAQIQYDNFLGRGTTVTLVAQMSSLRRLFNLAYITRYFPRLAWNFSFNIFNSRNVFPGRSRARAPACAWRCVGYPIPSAIPNLIPVPPATRSSTSRSGSAPSARSAACVAGAAPFLGGRRLLSLPQRLGAHLQPVQQRHHSAITRSASRHDRQLPVPQPRMRHADPGRVQQVLGLAEPRFNRCRRELALLLPIIQQQAGVPRLARVQDPPAGRLHPQPAGQGVPVFERYFPRRYLRRRRCPRLSPAALASARRSRCSSSDPNGDADPVQIGGNLLTALNPSSVHDGPARQHQGRGLRHGQRATTPSLYCVEANPVRPEANPCTLRPGARSAWSLRRSIGASASCQQSPIGPLRFEWGFPLDRLAAPSSITATNRSCSSSTSATAGEIPARTRLAAHAAANRVS